MHLCENWQAESHIDVEMQKAGKSQDEKVRILPLLNSIAIFL